MKLDVFKALRSPGQEFPFEGEQAIAPQSIGGDIVTFDEAHLSGTLTAADDDSITAEGVLTTVAHGHCARCLEPAETDIQTEFRETFLRDGDPEDAEIFVYSGSSVDFERLAMSYAVLALPMRLLCRPDCPGLAGYRVKSDEDIDSQATQEHPFAALQQLLTKDEEV